MSIKYILTENRLTANPNDHKATVQPAGVAELDDVINRMLQQGSTVTKADVVSVLENYFTAIENLVLEGMNVNTPSANYRVSVRGVFDGATDSFDPSRHQIIPVTTPGKRFRAAIKTRAQLVKGETIRPTPNPLEFTDVNTGERNRVATPGGMARVTGSRLKVNVSDPAQGIFFIAADGTEWKAAALGRNMPREMVFAIPVLPPGEYTLEVRATMPNSKTIRAGRLPERLMVTT